ncbi:MAG: MATE family efflux transporter [Muribaculaceae bacterium]|nr:MATE family efflux transporter [Muribaculaceae bacterium]
MKKSEKTGLDYASGKIGSLFFKLFFPTLLGMLFTALITIVDGIFVGKGVGPDGIAAVNIIAPLYMVSTGIGLMLGIGASVVAGMDLAADNIKRAGRTVFQAFAIGTFAMVLIVAVTLLVPEWTAKFLGSSDHLVSLATDYLCWLMPGTIFLAWSCIGMMTIRLDGSPKYAMMCNVIPAIINIVGDYILIFPCGMGVKGAAIATAGSIVIGGLMAILYFRRPYVLKLIFSFQGWISGISRIVAIGSSAFVTEIAMSVMMITGNYVFMRYYGDAGVAAYSIACYLFPLMFMMSNAVAQSAQPIISFNFGAGAIERVQKTFLLSLSVASFCGILVSGSIIYLSGDIVALFIPLTSEAGILADLGLPVFALCAVFFALNIAFIGFFQSVGKALRAMLLTLLRGVIFLVPLFFVLPVIWPSLGMWAAIPVAEILTLVVIIITSRNQIKIPR